MGRFLLGGLLGGAVFFAWTAVSWMVLPWHKDKMSSFEVEQPVMRAVGQAMDGRAGVYFFPGRPDDRKDEAAMEAYRKRHLQGPVGFMFVKPGAEAMPPSMFAQAGAMDIVIALIATLLVRSAGFRAYWQRVIFVTALGLFAGIMTHGAYWNWMHFPLDYSLVMFADSIVTCLLMGLVIAAVVKAPARRV